MGKRGPEQIVTKDAVPISIYLRTEQLIEIAKVQKIREMTRPGVIRLAVKEFLDRFWTEREG